MPFISVGTKMNIAIVTISLFLIVLVFVVMFSYFEEIKENRYREVQQELITKANNKIEHKFNFSSLNAILIANSSEIKLSLEEGNRDYITNFYKSLPKDIYKGVKINIYTKDKKLFVTNSNKKSLTLLENQKNINSFKVDNNSLFLSSINSISNKNKVIGYSEVLIDLKTISNNFNKNSLFLPFVEINKISIKGIDKEKFFKDGYFIDEKYFYTFKDILNLKNEKLGIIILATPIYDVNIVIDEAKDMLYIAIVGIFLIMLLIAFVVILANRVLVIKPLKKLEVGLNDFFLFLMGEKNEIKELSIKTNDEFGKIIRILKKNIILGTLFHDDILDRTKKVKSLLDNAGQGFLSFDKDLIIDNEYSKECIKLLGEKLSKEYIPNILFKNNLDKQKFFHKTVKEAFLMDSTIVQNSILTLLPSEIILNRRALKLDYKISIP